MIKILGLAAKALIGMTAIVTMNPIKKALSKQTFEHLMLRAQGLLETL